MLERRYARCPASARHSEREGRSVSFVLEGHRTEDVGAAPNSEGIAARSRYHCAQPSLRCFGQEARARPSLALYNNYEDIDSMVAALRRLKQLHSKWWSDLEVVAIIVESDLHGRTILSCKSQTDDGRSDPEIIDPTELDCFGL
jgi:hypothetical protein